MLTIPDAARRVGRNPETVRRWIREGKLRSSRVGTQYLVEEDDLDEILSGSEVMPRKSGDKTATGEAAPNFVAALHRSRLTR